MIVLDASAALDLLLLAPAAPRIEARLSQESEGACAPHLIDMEIAQVLRRHAARGVDPARCQLALEDWRAFPVKRYPHSELMMRVWSLRANFTAYDAVYLALAEILDAPLITRDRKLVSNAHDAQVEVV